MYKCIMDIDFSTVFFFDFLLHFGAVLIVTYIFVIFIDQHKSKYISRTGPIIPFFYFEQYTSSMISM